MNLRQNYRDWQESTRAIVTQLTATFAGDRLARGVDTIDDLIVTATAKGLVLRSPDGNYWRATISNVGALTWTNLGATKP